MCIFKIVRESNFVGGKFKFKFLSSINLPWGHVRSDPYKIWARSVQPFWRLLKTYPDRQETVSFCIKISFFKIEKNNLFFTKEINAESFFYIWKNGNSGEKYVLKIGKNHYLFLKENNFKVKRIQFFYFFTIWNKIKMKKIHPSKSENYFIIFLLRTLKAKNQMSSNFFVFAYKVAYYAIFKGFLSS